MSQDRPPLLIIAGSADGERLRAALTLACAEAALGSAASVFLMLDAVALLAPPISAPRDAAHAACGLPTLFALIDDALDLGVSLAVCQSGLALAGMQADALDPRIIPSGPVAILAANPAEARLLLA